MARMGIAVAMIFLYIFTAIFGDPPDLLAFLIGGAFLFLLPGYFLFRSGWRARQKKYLHTAKNQTDEDISGFVIPTVIADENEFSRRCLESEFNEEVEIRKWNSDPAFLKVLTPYNGQRFAAAIEEGLSLVLRFPDFDLLYSWIGEAYRMLSNLDESYRILLQGAKKSKRKCLLLIELAETSWRLNAMDKTIYFLSQALHCNPKVEEHNIYLLLSYIAKGMGLENEASSYLQLVDKLKSGQYRLNSSDADRLINSSKRAQSATFKKIIVELCKKAMDFFKKDDGETKDPKCAKCGLSNSEIIERENKKMATAARKLGTGSSGVIGNAIGICKDCNKNYCFAHSVKATDGWSDNLCPVCKKELDFYWDKQS
jgi:tetratricopeptide (TPR) repeat protein